MFGRFGHFYKFAADKVKDPYPTERYLNETKRLLGVLNDRRNQHDYIMDKGSTIADIAIFPWINTLTATYEAGDVPGLDSFPNVQADLA